MIDIEKILQYSQQLNLLYVEDNDDSREMTSMVLSDFFRDIITAVDGADGFEKFKNNHIDIILTDINMPELNGLQMIEKIREVDEDIPILVLSAYNEDDYFVGSIKLGVDGYLFKPIDIDQLVSTLARIVKKHQYMNEAKNYFHLLKEYQKATNAGSIVSKTDKKGIITFVNDKFCQISGYSKDELIGKNHNIIRHPDSPQSIFDDMWHTIKDKKDIWKGIVRNRTKENKSYYVDTIIMPVLDIDGHILEYISLSNDITDIMNPSKQLNDAVKNAKEPILVYLKLDNFSIIEEFYDNETIEKIEEKTTFAIQETFSKVYNFEKVYQLGNGEYAFIIEKSIYFKDEKSFIKEIKKCQNLLNSRTIYLKDIKYDISAVISLAYEKDKILESVKLGVKELMHLREDFIVANNLALKAQESAKNNMKIISLIKYAIENSKIVSYFQPIVNNKTKKIEKLESLVRLIDKNSQVLLPSFFLDIAKKSNYYTQITYQVLENSFAMLELCDEEISINISIVDLEQPRIREKIFIFLENYKDMAHRVIFEILEDENIKKPNQIKDFITEVKKKGVKIAIDDFGAKYSNYERLLYYQPDILKINGTLIKDIDKNEYSFSVVKSIVTFAKEQNITTVAKFVENEAIYNIVKNLGVEYSQGYYFGKPLSVYDCHNFQKENS